MKLFSLLIASVTVLASANGFAMARQIPQEIKDESVSDVAIQQSFALRAADGSLMTFQSSADQALAALKGLPPAKPSSAKCGGSGDINLILSLSQIAMDLISSPALSAADAKILQSTPRCEPYLDILAPIAKILTHAPDQDVIAKLSVVKSANGYALQLTTAAGRSALFQITGALAGVKSVKDLDRAQLDAASTGQNIAVRFDVSEPTVSDPSISHNTQSCTVFQTVNQCDSDHKCRDTVISVPGHQRSVSSTTISTYDVSMSLIAADGRKLMSAKLSDADFDTQSNDSPCFPDGPIRNDYGPRR